MNSCKTNEILKDIKTTATDIDTVLDNTYTKISLSQSDLDDINTNTFSTNDKLTQIDNVLDNIQTDTDTLNNKLVDIGVTLAAQNTTEKYTTSLWWDGTGEGLTTKDDFTTNHKYAYWQNTTGETVYITGFNVMYRTTDTTLEHWKVFNCNPADYLLGTSSNTSSVENNIFNIDRQWTLSAYYDKNISLPTGDIMVWKLTDFRYPLLNNEYAIAELDADTDHANFVELYTQVVYEKI